METSLYLYETEISTGAMFKQLSSVFEKTLQQLKILPKCNAFKNELTSATLFL